MLISVIIPLYNKEQSIASTLQTVLNQTFCDYEIVIVNDGSTDNSVAEVEKVLDPRIRLVHQRNAGVSAARNRGIEEAKGEFVAFLDADDIWNPAYLATQNKLVQKYPECDVYACNYEFESAAGNITSTVIKRLPFDGTDGVFPNYFEVACRSSPPLWTSAVMVRKRAIQTIGGFPVGVKSGEDLLVWARLASKYRLAYCVVPMAVYCQGHSIPRPPEIVDYVGNQLEQLYEADPKISDLKMYIAFWYKMRMCRCLAHRMWKASWIAFFKSVRYNPLQIKIYVSVLKYIMIGLR